MLKEATLIGAFLFLLVDAEFYIPEEHISTFRTGLDTLLKNIDPPKDSEYLEQKVKRDSGCPGGEGNYGFNSFNFMTFVLLVFNLVANVNNNLNNNNNNANKNNINAVNQDSNSVSSNTNAVNQLMVTILPIPGKRSVESLIRGYQSSVSRVCSKDGPHVTEPLADFALSLLLEVAGERSEACRGYRACLATKSLLHYVEIAEAFSVSLQSAGLSPFLTVTKCEQLFPQCFSM